MTLHWEWEFDVPREALWRYVADTDWINRHAGLPPISTRSVAQPDGSVKKLAWFRMGPIVTQWEERPTRWRAPDSYEVERRYTSGPLRLFVNRTALVPIDHQRTRIVVDIRMEASSAFTRPLLPALAMQGKAGAGRAFTLAAKLAAGKQQDRAPHSMGRFLQLRERGIDLETIETLDRFFAETDDRELATIHPYEVADRYGVSRKMMLRAFLAGTRVGLFNLRWGVICTSCRGTPNAYDTLSALQSNLHCPSCNIPYGPQFDRSVEVTFNARPMGRAVDVPLYCIASPQRSAHVISQTVVGPRADATIEVPFSAGSYDINAVGIGITPFIATQESSVRSVWASIEPLGVSIPHEIGTGMVELRLENATDREAIVRIEQGRWPDTIATAAQVTALQEFRDMFSSEVLAPGMELGVESMAVLFTDLIGSTAMYSRAGDAPAFKIVNDHFDRMRAVIEAHDGAIVKTIGDAVMAVFVDPAACLRAALQLDAAVRDLFHDGNSLRLRVGFHAGPCIAMRANDRIDYFGTTVNMAARLQSKAGGGEVTLAREMSARPDIDAELKRERVTTSQESVDVKGFEHPVAIVRVSAR